MTVRVETPAEPTVAAPAAAPARLHPRPPYRLFEVTGLELEYAVVDRELRPQCLVEDAFRVLHGRATSDVVCEDVGFSNELAAHVFELKTLEPAADLEAAEASLVRGVQRFMAVLREHFDARLLPTGMHPLMNPQETRLWRRSGRAIYDTYARLFDIHEHGWLNVQSCQTNLPFGSEEETMALHDAIACLLPYLPALAASTPLVEGRPGPSLCNRMEFYKSNQSRVPEIAGRIVPEHVGSFEEYRTRILAPMYAAVGRFEDTARLQHEFLNSRGAILRFDRSAIEIRVVDLQECVRMDVAIAIFVRRALQHLVRLQQEDQLRLPEHEMLVQDFDACVARGRAAIVDASHLCAAAGYRPGCATGQTALLLLLDFAHAEATPADVPYLRLVEDRVRRGNLAELILRATDVARRSEAEARAAISRVYGELATCLERNEPWAA
jgi:carboxylate-amine ligase